MDINVGWPGRVHDARVFEEDKAGHTFLTGKKK